MLTAWLTFLALMVLFIVLVSKVLFLGKKGVFAEKNFLWSSLELVFSLFALGFLFVVTVTNAYHSTIDNLMLPAAFESSIYLYIGAFLFTVIGFLWVIEIFTIVMNDVYASRKQFMDSKKNFNRMGKSANMQK